LDIVRALGLADYSAAREAVREATGTTTGSGAQLHVLSIGINDYGDHAPNLHLNYAEKDAEEFVAMLSSTQDPQSAGKAALYARVLPIYLPSTVATPRHILESLESVERNMAEDGLDLAVILFAGHGETVNGTFYLLPYGTDVSSQSSLETSAVPIVQFRDKLERIAAHGEVLLFLDACRSGAATNTQTDADTLRSAFIGNVVVLTSSSGHEGSREYDDLQHGAFTYLLLQALKGAGDSSKTGKITILDLVNYLSDRLPELTNSQQHLGVGPIANMQRVVFRVAQ